MQWHGGQRSHKLKMLIKRALQANRNGLFGPYKTAQMLGTVPCRVNPHGDERCLGRVKFWNTAFRGKPDADRNGKSF
jgi:hypothetical protein